MWLDAPVYPGHCFFMTRLLLIRHAATAVTAGQVLLGSTDLEASDSGLDRLARLAELLEPYSPAAWYCSPMRRAVQSMEKLRHLGCLRGKVKKEGRLREIDFGRWEQKRFADIAAEDPSMVHVWSKYEDFVFPGGESVADFTGRVAEMLELFRSSGMKEIGVITHGGVIRSMICLALGLDARNYLLFSVQPASLNILDLHSEGGVLEGLNL